MNNSSRMNSKNKVDKLVEEMFQRLVNDIPREELKGSSYVMTEGSYLVLCDNFLGMVSTCTQSMLSKSETIKKNENRISSQSAIEIVIRLPQIIKKIKIVKNGLDISKIQKNILAKYFTPGSQDNISDKISELKRALNDIIHDGKEELVDEVLANFESRMRNGLLSDLRVLSEKLDKKYNKVNKNGGVQL